MANNINVAIKGIHAWVPEHILSNSDIEKMVDTTDDWITTRTGIKERRILKNEPTSHIGMKSVKELLKKTNTDPDEVDLLICATATPDMLFPSTACVIADKVGIKNAFAFDLMAACSGFLYSLTTAEKYIKSGMCKKAIVVGADKMSSIINYQDRSTCVIFGDGGGAVLLESTSEDVGIVDSILNSDGSGREFLHMKAGGSDKPASIKTVQEREHFVYQEGQSVFKFAVKNMADVSAQIMEKNKLTSNDIAWLVPHQANKRIIDATANRMGIDHEKVMLNIHKYGNTTNGTIPLCLWEWENKLKKGDNIILAAFGGGFTWGAIYLKWAYN